MFALSLNIWLVFVAFSVSFAVQRSRTFRTGHFDTTGKGKSLQGHVFDTRSVNSLFDCTIECLSDPRCESFNLQLGANQSRACELNSKCATNDELDDRPGYIYYSERRQCIVTSSCASSPCENGGQCIDQSSQLSFQCVCTKEYIGATCSFQTGNYSLIFPARNTSYFARNNISQDLSAFTLCLWIKFTQQERATLFSYTVPGGNLAMALKYIGDGISEFTLNGTVSELFSAPLNDNVWHHVCVTWDTVADVSKINFFVDGFQRSVEEADAKGFVVRGGGDFIVGQTQSVYGGAFDPNESFSGHMTTVNMWDSALNDTYILQNSQQCSSKPGNALQWTAFIPNLNLLRPVIPSGCHVSQRSFIQHLSRQNESYASTTISKTLSEFTVSFWINIKWCPAYFYSYRVEGVGADLFQLTVNYDAVFTSTVNGVSRQFSVMIIPNGGIWHHIGLTWKNTNGSHRCYLDGAVALDITGFQVSEVIPADGALYIGQNVRNDGTLDIDQAALTGSLSGFNIWDKAFSGEVMTSISRGDGFESGNVFSWKALTNFIQGDGTIVNSRAPVESSARVSANNFLLVFPSASSTNWAQFDGVIPDLHEVAACVWVRSTKTEGAIFQYATEASADAFGLYIYEDYVSVAVNDRWKYTDYLPLIFEKEHWHFLCIEWTQVEGKWTVYYNGEAVYQELNLNTDGLIQGGGIFVYGQEMDSYGGSFQSSQAFRGYMSNVNIWSFSVKAFIPTMSTGCNALQGDVVYWRDFGIVLHGNVERKDFAPCFIVDYVTSKKRDLWCENNIPADMWPAGCAVETKPKALFDSHNSFGKYTRCYLPSALNVTENGLYTYDEKSASPCVVEENDLKAIQD